MPNKFQIYYQPKSDNVEGIRSFTVSFYNFDTEHQTYYQKCVLEKNGAKYKIKQLMNGLDFLLVKLNSLKFPTEMKPINFTEEHYYLKYDDEMFYTDNKEDIADILRIFNFHILYNQDESLYQRVD